MNKENKRPQNIKERFFLNFDLHQQELKKAGFGDRPLDAYQELGKSLESIGYEKRQQSSWFSENPKNEMEILDDLDTLLTKHPWLKPCTNHFTATAENAVFDLNPFFREEMTAEEFLSFENKKGNLKEQRAIHFDLDTDKIDEHYSYRSKPYTEIYNAMHELGFERQQGSVYISDNELTPEQFVHAVEQLKKKVPKLEKVVKKIDASYLKDTWDLTPYISKYQENSFENTMDQRLSLNEVLMLNKKIRYQQESPKALIGKSFEYDKINYEIQDIQKNENLPKDTATLKRLSDGKLFQDKDFASTIPFKLNLIEYQKSNQLQNEKAGAEKIKSK